MDVAPEALVPRRAPPAGPVTFERFLEWCDDATHAEWVDGRVILLDVTVAERHDFIVRLLSWIFGTACRLGQIGDVHGEPYQMRLAGLRRSRSPDLFFVRAERRHLLGRHYLDGPGDVVVEVVSPESAHRDRVEKLAEYERAGVPEYWIVDPESRTLEVRLLAPDGAYRLAFAGGAGPYRSAVLPPLRLHAEWLWQHPGPDLAEVLRELGL